MELWDSFKIDSWWKGVLLAGVALIAASLLFEIEFISRKHLMGVGIGMFLVGLANWMALKTVINEYGGHGFFHGQIPIHNTFTKALEVIGSVVAVAFLGMVIWGLI